MRTLYFYRFRYFATLRNKWVTARYAAERQSPDQGDDRDKTRHFV